MSINIGKIMYYRITKATVQPGKFNEAMATMELLRESISKINGLVSSNLIRISETEMIGVAAYESKEHLEASQTEFKELMVNMMPYMAGAPDVSFGESIFSFKW
jgi:quinol monooxygenase YgiN